MIVNVPMEFDVTQAFNILCGVVCVEIDEDNPPEFSVDKYGDIVCDCDNRGELYLAMYHLATKLFPNVAFRNIFDNPNALMSDLYLQQLNKQLEDENVTND